MDELVHAATTDDLSHPSRGDARFRLWLEIRELGQAKCAMSAEAIDAIGRRIADSLKQARPRLVLIPLRNGNHPSRRTPARYPLGPGVWLVERPGRGSVLASMLQEHFDVTEAVAQQLGSIVAPETHEQGALLECPLLVVLDAGDFGSRAAIVDDLVVPLIALHNLVRVSASATWSPLGDQPFLGAADLFFLPEPWTSEWLAADGADGHRAHSAGSDALPDQPDQSGSSLVFGRRENRSGTPSSVLWFDVNDDGICPAHVARHVVPLPPDILILPSIMESVELQRLVEWALQAGGTPKLPDLHERMAHAIRYWALALREGRSETFYVGFEENDERIAVANPDLFILFSTIVLESLLSSPSEREGVTARVADLTACVLADVPDERLRIAARVRTAYDARSAVVHGRPERSREHEAHGEWLFGVATHVLWRVIRWSLLDGGERRDCWDQLDVRLRLARLGGRL